jgi:hypothetical protein
MLEFRPDATTRVFALTEALSAEDVERLEADIDAALDDGCERIVIDLLALTSAGGSLPRLSRVIVRAACHADEVVVVHGDPAVRGTIEAAGPDSELTFASNLQLLRSG